MTQLHITSAEMVTAELDGRGGLIIELTDEGERKLLEAACIRSRRLEAQAARRRPKLAAMSNDKLIAVALSRPGGPDQLERDELGRRLRLIVQTLRPAFAAARAAGLIPAA